MTSPLPTVRVANPRSPETFMTMNAADYREIVHGPLWHEQAPDYAGLPERPAAAYSEPERRFAAELMLETLAFRERALNDRDFADLSPVDRMTVLRDARTDFERGRDEFNQRRLRDGAVTSAAKSGHPANVMRGAVEQVLTDANRDPGARKETDPGATGATQAAGATGTGATGTTAAPASAPVGATGAAQAPAAPSWAKKPADGPTGGTGATGGATSGATGTRAVEKGPGGKWYVMADGNPVSAGFTKKSDADAELEKLNKA